MEQPEMSKNPINPYLLIIGCLVGKESFLKQFFITTHPLTSMINRITASMHSRPPPFDWIRTICASSKYFIYISENRTPKWSRTFRIDADVGRHSWSG
ncbi:hypothetical protein BS17DRAFT_788960 [Gyrodon lividus]|nr:hypothetical protein BS17DRAFT_788960 [Gyrodon lividus]